MNNLLFLKTFRFLLKFKTYFQFFQNLKRIFSNGFTLLELIVVIAIIGILAGIAVPAYFTFIEKAKITRAISDIGMLEKEILEWEGDKGNLPVNLDEMGRGGLLDPWGNPYQYLNFDTINGNGKKRKDHNLVPINDQFDLYSMGKDGKSQAPLTAKASRDDIIRANNGSYKGIASEYS